MGSQISVRKIISLPLTPLPNFSTILFKSGTVFCTELIRIGLESKTCPSGRGRHLPSLYAQNTLGHSESGHSFPKKGATP